MDAQRALLDSLMGFNRDGDRPDEATLDFSHPRVCKPYLCGLCPRELFQHTRLDTGACELLHVPALRSTFQQQEQESKRDFDYERDLAKELSKLLADVEKKIARAQKRLDEDGDDNQDKTQILQLTQDMQDAAAQAEQAAKDGEADKSLQLMEQVELLKRKRRELLWQSNTAASSTGANASVAMMVDNVNQKLRVCDVCGAFLSIFDSDRRLADHFGGKVHMGYVQIRKKLKELMEKEKEHKKEEAPRREGRRPVGRSRREESPRRRRETGLERSRVDGRERPRESDRARSREPRRDRNRRSGRSHRRRRSMSSSRSRSRSHERKRRRSHRYRH